MEISSFLETLSADERFSPYMVHTKKIPARNPSYRSGDDFPLIIRDYLKKKGITLYSHQYEVFHATRQGSSVILCTATASGKTLAFTLPYAACVIENPGATALAIYPTKALAQDQKKTFEAIGTDIGIDLAAAIYDGDTPRSSRPAIRKNARLIVTNPYEIHHILSWHHQWRRFFSGLSLIIIDEAHQYRGVFGSHMAFLIRRLRRICRYYGSDPVFVLASATLANPSHFAENLIGKPCITITNDGSPGSNRYFILYNPYKNRIEERSLFSESAALVAASVQAGFQTLCFTGSRKITELIATWAQNRYKVVNKTSDAPIRAYRAGYLPEERRYLEDSLKTGKIRGIISTNALELGIDIGGLDTVILTGYPGTMISTWQQAGRAGRSGKDALAILVAAQNPLDQYFVHHPREFFERSHEHAIIDTKNPYIVAGHLLCAASELPVTPDGDICFFGRDLPLILDAHARTKLIAKTGHGFVYAGTRRACDLVSLNGVSSSVTYTVLSQDGVLETLDTGQAHREAYPGAILLHQGRRFLVTDWNRSLQTIRAIKTDISYHTRVTMTTRDISIIEEEKTRHYSGYSLHYGSVSVTEAVSGYKKILSDQVIDTVELNMPPVSFLTQSVWVTISPEICAGMVTAGYDPAGALHGAEHALIAMFPFYVLCDRWDLGGFSCYLAGGISEPTIFIYDGYCGGIGLSERAYEIFSELATKTGEMVRGCPCREGCPSCIFSPKCGNDNEPLDKAGTVHLLSLFTGD